MDHSWRPPPPLPPIPGNTTTTTCPICSISHFPFCPPFIENPRFHHSQSPTDYHHQPPPPRFDHHHHPLPNHHHQSSLNYIYDCNPSDGYGARRPTTWYGGNPSLDMSPYDGYDNGGIKRMKVEAFDYNNRGIRGPSSIGGGGGEIGDISRVSSDNERILKLIHDHGNAAANAAPKVDADLFSESGRYNNTHGRFAESREVRDDNGLKRKAISEFRYDQRDELGQSQYDPIENSIPNSLDYGRHSSSQQARVFTNAEQFEQTRDHHRGGAAAFRSESLPENYQHLQPITQSNVAIVNKTNLQPNHSLLSSRLPTEVNRPVDEGIPSSIRHHNSQPSYSWSELKGHYGHNSFRNNFGPVDVPHAYHGQPPLPASPPPPLPIDPPRNHFFEPLASSPAKKPSSLFPISVSSSAADSSSLRSAIPENQSPAQVYYANNAGHHASTLSSAEEFHTHQSSSEKYARDVQPYPLRHLASEKPNIIDASHIFKLPHRASRPDHLVVILRGLPGSGKSYLAKVLRDIEVDNGGEAPRIHSMDEYFMTEVEKAEDSESSKSSGSLRGKRQVMKTVMEYCYEPEMEEAYRASMLKAFKKTLDEGIYSFIIVDDRNLRVADFAQFWATAKRSGYEVYLVEAAYKDPAGCAARNVHNFTLDDIQKMAGQWEEAPSLYLKMDIKSLLHGDGFDESGIQEVDMDMDDEDATQASPRPNIKSPQDDVKDQVDEHELTPRDVGPMKDVKHPVTNHVTEEVNHLSKSKWSNDLDGSESLEAEGGKRNGSALSGLIQAYSKEGKSVRWGDQGGNIGFSISATRKTNTRSLVIGPGSGYNLKSNPLSEEEYLKPPQKTVEPKSQNVFQERIRAERESFKAVFVKRQQRRIGGFNIDDE